MRAELHPSIVALLALAANSAVQESGGACCTHRLGQALLLKIWPRRAVR